MNRCARLFKRIVIKTNKIADLQQYCYTNERMSTQFERHEPTFTGKQRNETLLDCLHLFPTLSPITPKS